VLSAVPAYSSLPGAPASLYLDFDGHDAGTWNGHPNAVAAAFDFDGSRFLSTAERQAIEIIWKNVAEDYAPFNINVTTVEPASFADKKGLRVAIGGASTDWYGVSGIAGVALRDSFTTPDPNVVFVFSKTIGNDARSIAATASHEAGHAFGLRHQTASTSGIDKVPLMTAASDGWRNTWHVGTNVDGVTQDDMAIIGGTVNGFGYRGDDHGNTSGTATALTAAKGLVSATGIIGKTTDVDYFSFTTTGGDVEFTLNRVAPEANLAARMEIRNLKGALIAYVDPGLGVFQQKLTAYLAPGTYRLVVKSHGAAGDVGQYQLTGRVTDTRGPRILGSTAVVYKSGIRDANTIRVKFSEPINPSTFTLADVSIAAITAPFSAVPVSVKPVAGTGNRWFEIVLGTPLAVGKYSLKIGPDIKDAYGNKMDQNGNGINGEPPGWDDIDGGPIAGDQYQSTFRVESSP
jgi:hypothetical protein